MLRRWLLALLVLYGAQALLGWCVGSYVAETFKHLMEPLQCAFR